MTAPYTAGTIDLVSGSPAVVGTDTAWEVSLIIGGTIYVQFDGGNPLPIAAVNGDTEITAALNWTGPTGTYSYAIVRDTAYGQQTVANAQALATYIQRLNNPALAAAAGVTPSADTLLLFTGTNTATVIDLADVSGDFSGPSGGVVENDLVAFSDATGKAGKKAPDGSIPNRLFSPVPTKTLKGRISASDGPVEDLTAAQANQLLGGWEPIGLINMAGLTTAVITNLSAFSRIRCTSSISLSSGAGTYFVIQVSADNGVTFLSAVSDYEFTLDDAIYNGSTTTSSVSSAQFPGIFVGDITCAGTTEIFNFNKARPALSIGQFVSRSPTTRVNRTIGTTTAASGARNALRVQAQGSSPVATYGELFFEGFRG